MFVMDMPDIPPQHAQVVVAQASQTKKGGSKTGHAVGVCHLIQNPPMPPETAVNAISPLASASDYLQTREPKALDWKSSKVSISQGPANGKLEDEGTGNYRYTPTPDYYGQDRATLLIEVSGLTVRVVYFFNVMRIVGGTDGYDPYEDKKNCPKGEMWKISLSTDADLWFNGFRRT